MVELICVACGRTNPSDAKFCSECGAALLRRFCDQCRAVNDAEAHFCRACGAALPAQLVPAASIPVSGGRGGAAWPRLPPRAHIPTLNPVVPAEEGGAAPTAPAPESGQAPGPDDAAEIPAADGAPRAARPAHRTALFAVGGLVVLLLALTLWSRAPRTPVRPPAPEAASGQGAALIDVPAPVAAPPGTTATGSGEPVEGRAPATSGVPEKTGASGAEPAPPPTDTAQPAAPTPGIVAEPRRPAVANRPPRETATPAPSPSPPAPIPECTSQRDALGLCAPGTTITGR